jgi:hypothetical protein
LNQSSYKAQLSALSTYAGGSRIDGILSLRTDSRSFFVALACHSPPKKVFLTRFNFAILAAGHEEL